MLRVEVLKCLNDYVLPITSTILNKRKNRYDSQNPCQLDNFSNLVFMYRLKASNHKAPQMSKQHLESCQKSMTKLFGEKCYPITISGKTSVANLWQVLICHTVFMWQLPCDFIKNTNLISSVKDKIKTNAQCEFDLKTIKTS